MSAIHFVYMKLLSKKHGPNYSGNYQQTSLHKVQGKVCMSSAIQYFVQY